MILSMILGIYFHHSSLQAVNVVGGTVTTLKITSKESMKTHFTMWWKSFSSWEKIISESENFASHLQTLHVTQYTYPMYIRSHVYLMHVLDNKLHVLGNCYPTYIVSQHIWHPTCVIQHIHACTQPTYPMYITMLWNTYVCYPI